MSPVVIFRDEQTKERAIARIKAIKPDQERPLALWIGPYKKIRSLEQNARYWKRIGIIAAATGHDRHTLHEFFKRRVFGVHVESVCGSLVEYTKSSAKVSTGDFSELIDSVEEFIAEHGIEEAA